LAQSDKILALCRREARLRKQPLPPPDQPVSMNRGSRYSFVRCGLYAAMVWITTIFISSVMCVACIVPDTWIFHDAARGGVPHHRYPEPYESEVISEDERFGTL